MFGLAWLLPGHYPPWVSFQAEAMTALGLVCFGFGVLWTRRGGEVAWPAVAKGMGALAAIPMLQWAAGQILFFSDAILPTLYLLACALAIVIGRVGFGGPEGHRWLARWLSVFIVAGAVSVAIELLQWQGVQYLWLADLRPGDRPYANIAQPNHLATLMGLAWLAVLYLYETHRMSSRAAAALALWLGLGLVMTQSRTAWVFSAGLVVWWGWFRQRAGLRTGSGVIVIAVLVLVTAVVYWPRLNEALLLPQASPWAERMVPGTRGALWQGLLAAVAQSPWWGWGWGQVVVAQQAVAVHQEVGSRMLEYSHNMALDLMLWLGVPLAGLVLLGLVYWVWRHIMCCRTPEQWCLIGALGVIGVHSMTEYPLAYLYFLVPIGLLMGALEAQIPSQPVRHGVAFAGGLGLVLLLMFGLIGREYLASEESERSVRMSLARIGSDPDAEIDFPAVHFLDSVVAYQRFRLQLAHAGMSDDELESMHKVSLRHPFPPAMLRYALAAGLNHRPEQAKATLVALCHMHPKPTCDDARQSWAAAQVRYPVLAAIAAP